jgi:hypothetical protein
MASAGTAVPGNVNLAKQKPYAVSAYSRRVKSLANNAQRFGPDQYVNITLDTSTPGSFLDPLQSYLKFDLNLKNTNPFADFASFGAAGAASVIEEFRIYVQGTPIEEILQYNTFYELAMNQNSQCQQPFHLFRPNENGQNISSLFHQNAIKPPMVDLEGRPMYGSVRASSAGNDRSSAWAYANTANTTSPGFLNCDLIQSQASVSTKVCFSGTRPYFTAAPGVNANYSLVADAHALLFGVGRTTASEGAITATSNLTAAANAQFVHPSSYRLPLADGNVDNAQTVTTAVVSAVAGGGSASRSQPSIGLDAYSLRSTTSDATASIFGNYLTTFNGGIMPYSGTSVSFPSKLDNSAESVDPDIDPTNPLNWCSFLPTTTIRPDMKTLGPQNLQDYFMFLTNTKYLPIGMPGLSKEDPTSYDNPAIPDGFISSTNFRNIKPYVVTKEQITTYTCCVPLISGILGSFAEKCWPTMLVAPGSMYIQIRTAVPQKALQLSMDPCRRVLGTIRDYLPFGGTIGGVFGQFGTREVTSTELGGAENYSSYVINNAAATPTFANYSSVDGVLPRSTFSKYQAPATFTQVTNGIDTKLDSRFVHSQMNAYACIGMTLTSASNALSINYLKGEVASKGFGLMFRPYSVAALEGRWTIGRAYVSQMAGLAVANMYQASEEGSAILGANNARGSDLVPNNSFGTQLPGSGTLAAANNVRYPTNGAAAASLASVAARSNGNVSYPVADVTVDFSPSGIPLPQYWLTSQPWTKKTFGYKYVPGTKSYQFVGIPQVDVAWEGDACFGTYLTASVPQCRRLFTNASSTGTTTYDLSNIEFVSQQIILPDTVSASILEEAASGDISISSNSVHNYSTPVAQSNSQNLIIPAKIASANTMYCLFVPQAFLSGNEAFCYNSLRGICPFGALEVTSGIVPNGLTGAYNKALSLGYDAGQVRVQNIGCGSGQFQIQLKVGNELIPQQPLTTVSEIVTENVKAQHKLFDTLSNVNQTYGLSTSVLNILGDSTASLTGLAYDVIKPESFVTTFVSAELCDDQTAINSSSMAWVYAAENNFTATNKKLSDYVIGRKPYGLELFQPPPSTFCLAFDLDTWSRYSDVTRSGKFLGNNVITLTLDRALALGVSNQNSLAQGYVLQTFVVHDIRFSFQAGGSVVSYY